MIKKLQIVNCNFSLDIHNNKFFRICFIQLLDLYNFSEIEDIKGLEMVKV